MPKGKWIREPTGPEERAYFNSWAYVTKLRDWEEPSWTLRQHLQGYYASGFRGGEDEYRDQQLWHKGALDKQDPNFTRYAFYTEIPVVDVVLALKARLQLEIDWQFEQIENLLSYSGTVRYTSRAYLKSALGLTDANAEWWLKVLVYLTLRRYDFDMVHYDPGAWSVKADVISIFPWLTVFWREIPQEFYDLVVKKTGLEGDELQDKVDEIIFEATSPIKTVQWIETLYRIAAEKKARRDRFKTYLIIAMVAVVILPTVYLAFKSALSVWSHVAAWEVSTFAKFKLALTAFTDVLGAGFSAFLTAIHYDTLIGVHRIAELVSEDYRNVMRGVYGEITRVSSALGYGPYTLLLLTQNSKRLIQDVSSTIGMEWNLSEVQWLSTFQSYMTNFSRAAYKYRGDPEALLYDMGRWIDRDAVNAKGAFMASLTQSVDGLLKDVENFVGDLVIIREDVNTLVKDLPEKLSKQIADAIDPYISQFDDFITGTYDPYRKVIGDLVDTIQAHQAEIKERAELLADRLKKPADYLLEIDTFTDEERLNQETKLDDLSSRYYKRQLTASSEAIEPISAELGKIRAILTRPLEIAFMGVEEITAPVPIPIGEIDPSKTWFVGDY